MALKNDYTRSVALRCMTCGASYAFETDEKTGYVTCQKCNRVYRGGEEELLVEEVQKDIFMEHPR